MLLKLSCWNQGPGQSHTNLIVSLSLGVCSVTMFFCKTCSHPVICILAHCTLQFLHRKDKNKCFEHFFPHFYFCIISKCFIATILEECCIFLPVLASFFTWWQYCGEQPPRRRLRKTLGCHRDADDSAPSGKVKTDRGGLNNIVSAAKKKEKKKQEKKKNVPPGRHKHHQ